MDLTALFVVCQHLEFCEHQKKILMLVCKYLNTSIKNSEINSSCPKRYCFFEHGIVPIRSLWNNKLCSYMARYGHINRLIYLHENGCSLDGEDIDYFAAENGHLDCLKYVHENGCEWSFFCEIAARNGHLDCLKYAHENGCPWARDDSSIVCRSATHGGHLDCLRYVHQAGCRQENACSYAAEYGHLDCLKYAYENVDDLWRINCSLKAAQYGHIDCLKYVHKNGSYLSIRDCYAAIEYGHLDCVLYILEKENLPSYETFLKGIKDFDYRRCEVFLKKHENKILKYFSKKNICLKNTKILS
jgi:hypothetical protein